MEPIVDDIDAVHAAPPVMSQEAEQVEAHEKYTPGNFFRQFGLVIAICLGLATLAQLLVPMLE